MTPLDAFRNRLEMLRERRAQTWQRRSEIEDRINNLVREKAHLDQILAEQDFPIRLFEPLDDPDLAEIGEVTEARPTEAALAEPSAGAAASGSTSTPGNRLGLGIGQEKPKRVVKTGLNRKPHRNMRGEVLAYLEARPVEGATVEDIAKNLGVPGWRHDGIRAALKYHSDRGRVAVFAGGLWRAVERGRNAAAFAEPAPAVASASNDASNEGAKIDTPDLPPEVVEEEISKLSSLLSAFDDGMTVLQIESRGIKAPIIQAALAGGVVEEVKNGNWTVYRLAGQGASDLAPERARL